MLPKPLSLSCTNTTGSSSDSCDWGLYGVNANAFLDNLYIPDQELDSTSNALQPKPAESETIEQILKRFAYNESHILSENVGLAIL